MKSIKGVFLKLIVKQSPFWKPEFIHYMPATSHIEHST
jgi:hypothetical protein